MYDSILLPTDGSQGAADATAHAIDAADRYDADLHVLYVVDERVYGAYSGDEFVHEREGAEETIRETGEDVLADVMAQAEDAGVSVTTALEDGIPHEEIVDYVGDEGVDAVVIGTEQKSGEYRQMIGSVSDRVLRLVDIPVTVVKSD